MGHTRAPLTRRIAGLGLAAGASLALASITALPATAEGTILGAGSPNAVKGSYIVVFNDTIGVQSVAGLTSSLAAEHDATVKHSYSTALRGFSATMSEADAKRLAADPAVAHVEQDQRMSISATQSPTPSWGLDRIDQRDLPLNNSYTYDATGSGVTAYIIDTGIRTTHSDFGTRAVWGTNTVDSNNTDCNGHGTHVAGTVGGTAYGVAKGVRLVAVKVLNCSGSGTNAGVIAGVDWVTSNHTSGPAVANMSLGGGASSALDTAVRNSIADGVTYALASGNSNTSACSSSPARVAEGITVNASTNTDARASFSNYGTCTDIFAPGQNITSAWHTSNSATNTISGTSMATPHVAGAAALYLQGNPGASPSSVATAMYNNSTPNKISNPGSGSPNRLLYVGSGSNPPPPPPPPPGCSGTNGNNVNIPDYGSAVSSSVGISGCNRNASASSQVSVDIRHTFRGDLIVDLVAPDGSTYRLKNSSAYDSADNVIGTFTVNLSSESANGTWRLQVRDVYRYDTGYINSFGITV